MDKLENKWLSVLLSERGAEVKSIIGKLTHHEYMWKDESVYADSSSPLLFPVVGRLCGDGCLIDGQRFMLPENGFVRNVMFEKVSASSRRVVYRLDSTARMHRMFPFPFRLIVDYKLTANHIDVTFSVLNTGLDDLFFHIGISPSIVYPDFRLQDKVHGYFDFNHKASVRSAHISEERYIKGPFTVKPVKGTLMPIDSNTFGKGSLLIEDKQIHQVTLCDKSSRAYFTILSHSPVFVLRSDVGIGVPCVVFGSWFGITDHADKEADFRGHPLINTVGAGHQMDFTAVLRMDGEAQPEVLSVRKGVRLGRPSGK